MNKRSIYLDSINDVAMEISLSKPWRERIFQLNPDDKIKISASEKCPLPKYIKDIITDYDLVFFVQTVDKCEESFDDGLIIFKFCSAEYPDIVAYSGNNPNVV